MPKSAKPGERLHVFVIITLFFLIAFALTALILATLPENPPVSGLGGFCGTSSLAGCSSDSDCVKGGCSGQICYGKSEEPVATTCEWTECYDAQKYGVSCGCSAGKCQWKK